MLTPSLVCPVFWFTAPELGGYGFTPIQISMFLGGIGISQGIWLLVAFPYLQRRFGTGAILRACYIAWPIFFVAAPICNLFLRWGGKWETAFWIVSPTLQIGGSGVSMAFSKSFPFLLYTSHLFILPFPLLTPRIIMLLIQKLTSSSL